MKKYKASTSMSELPRRIKIKEKGKKILGTKLKNELVWLLLALLFYYFIELLYFILLLPGLLLCHAPRFLVRGD